MPDPLIRVHDLEEIFPCLSASMTRWRRLAGRTNFDEIAGKLLEAVDQ